MHKPLTDPATEPFAVGTPAPAFTTTPERDDTTRAALLSFALSALAGALVSALVTFQAPGVGTLIAGLTLVGTWVALAVVRERAVGKRERIALAALAVLAAMPLFRASGWLLAYDVVLFAGFALALPSLAAGRAGAFTFTRAARAAATNAVSALTGPAVCARDELDVTSAMARVRGPLIGIVIALPIFAVFLGLFASADPVFAKLFEDLVTPSKGGGRTPAHVAVALVAGWAVCGLAYRALRRADKRDEPHDAARAPDGTRPEADTTPLVSGLGLVVGLFVLFVVVQVVQIVGFADALAIPGVTYARAAREGFFQLLAVTALVVVCVPVVAWLADRRGGSRAVRALLFALVGLTVFVALSALLRMFRYTDSYGLTELRLHATAAMVLLVGVLALMWGTVLRGRRERFLPAALALGFVGVLALHALNPDATIARWNIERDHSVVKVDVWHLAQLSDDALPAVADYTSSLSDEQRVYLCERLDARADLARYRLDKWSALSWSLPLERAQTARCK